MSREIRRNVVDLIPVVGKLTQHRRERLQTQEQQLEETRQALHRKGFNTSDIVVKKFVPTYNYLEGYQFGLFISDLVKFVGFNAKDLPETEIIRLANMWLFRDGIE